MQESIVFIHPISMREALDAYASDPGRIIPFAGGTDVFTAAKGSPHVDPEKRYLCLNRLQDLKTIETCAQDLWIGAAVTLSELLASPLIQEHAPLLSQAARCVASPPIRNLATLAGNVINASPAGDALTALVCLQAEAELLRLEGSEIVCRMLAVSELVVGPGKTALLPGELVARFRIPSAAGWHCAYEKVGLRNSLAISVVGLAVMWNTRMPSLHIALGAVGPHTVCDTIAEKLMLEGSVEEAVERYMACISPIDDLRASAAYRRNVTKRLLRHYGKTIQEELA